MALQSNIVFFALALMLKGGFILATILKCESPQYIVLGTEGIVECLFPAEFKAIVWYDSSNIEQAHVTRLEKQNNGELKASGDGYESKSYDILLNGTLIIRSVTIHHERNFKVLLVDKESTFTQKEIRLMTVVRSGQSTPKVSSCQTGILCLTTLMKTDNLTCTFNKARPAVSLSWHQHNKEGKETLEAQTNITIDGQFTFTSSSTVNASQLMNRPLTLLSCRASGPALSPGQGEVKVLVSSVDKSNEYINNINIFERTVIINTNLEIPCTTRRKPVAFVWSFERHDFITFLAYSALGDVKLNDYVNHTFSVFQDGTITFENVNYLLEGVLTCTFLESGESSFSMIRVKVVGQNDRTFQTAIWIAVGVLLVVLGACLIVYFIAKPKLPCRKISAIDVCREVADALLNCPFVFESDPSLFGEDAIDLLRFIRDEAIKNKRRKDKAAAAGAGASAAGGAVAIVGTFLLPITLGGSIPLIASGVALGMTGTGLSTGFAIDKSIKDTKRFERAKPSFELYVKVQKNLAASVAHIANAFEIIELYVSNKEDKSNVALDTKVNEMKKLLKQICILRVNRGLTAQDKIEKVMEYSKQFVEMLLEGVEESKVLPLNIFEERKEAFTMIEERVFDSLPDTVIKLLSFYGSFNTPIFTFCSFIHNLYAPNFTPKANDDMKRAVVFQIGKSVIKEAAVATRMGVQVLNVGDDIAKVGTNVAQLAKGVAVAGLVLGFVGIGVDIAFLGKAIYDIKKDKTEELPKALGDAADIMETMNEIIRKGVQPDAVAES